MKYPLHQSIDEALNQTDEQLGKEFREMLITLRDKHIGLRTIVPYSKDRIYLIRSSEDDLDLV